MMDGVPEKEGEGVLLLGSNSILTVMHDLELKGL
jgi:hypothetical protein